jgi:hypothetical protein
MRFALPITIFAAVSLAAAPAAAAANQASALSVRAAPQMETAEANALGDMPLGAFHYLAFIAIVAGLGYLIYTQLEGDEESESP